VPAPSSPPDLRPLTNADLPSAVASAARAFHDDPLFNFFEPNLLKQARRLPALMRATIVDTLPLAETYAAFDHGKAKAVAAWMPPGGYPRSPRREGMFLARAAPSMVRSGRRLPAALKLLAAIDKVHPKPDHWYLALLAVDPELQGRGIGGALVAQMLQRADRDGLPAYLETQTEANVAWYRRFGFEVVDTIALPGVAGAPTMWALQREPQQP
jgi:ribosomal protein S18 acetylase RimI-like enzyme